MLRLGIALALGFVINIAVAWGCGLWSGYDIDTMRHGSWSQSRLLDAKRTPMLVWMVRGFGVMHLHVLPVSFFQEPAHEPIEDVLGDWGRITDLEELYALADGQNIDFFSQGWPMHALWCERVENEQLTRGGVWMSQQLMPGTFYSAEHVLAFRPIWIGFAVNTMFYGCAAWLVFMLPFTLRRWRRVRLGLCPKCAYPRGTRDVCTECGTALAGKSSTM